MYPGAIVIPHAVCDDNPDVGQLYPIEHAVADPEPAGQYVPTGHCTALSPPGQYDPAGQLSHAPVVLLKKYPALHCIVHSLVMVVDVVEADEQLMHFL